MYAMINNCVGPESVCFIENLCPYRSVLNRYCINIKLVNPYLPKCVK